MVTEYLSKTTGVWIKFDSSPSELEVKALLMYKYQLR